MPSVANPGPPSRASTPQPPFPNSPPPTQSRPHHSHLSRNSYFAGDPVDDETASNTIANSTASNTIAYSSTHSPPRRPERSAPALAAVRPARFTEQWGASQRGGSLAEDYDYNNNNVNMQRAGSLNGSAGPADGAQPAPGLSRGNTLKKRSSVRRTGSLGRSSSRRSMRAGSVRSLALQSSSAEGDAARSAFYCPVPTTGNPTEVLAARFQAWRKVLKDLISYFREIQSHYEHRSKSLQRLGGVLGNTSMPSGFLASGGLDDALQLLRGHNRQAIAESIKAKDIEEDVILALTGLRSDLRQKIKEIKNLSSDFKNSVDKEMDGTRKAVNSLQDVLAQLDTDPSTATGKQDPYLLKLSADRQLERQVDEESYLHQAYLNLESSGRELEAIVVGEIQKSYNAYAGILKREADAAYSTVEELRVGPIAMPKDHEWRAFVQSEAQLVDPDVPIRSAEQIHYPGRDHYACQEIRAGLLERKSKYLKSYTAGWYVLSPTHLHEFKSADKTQAPIMSLYLPEQKLGSHSTGGGSSNKFVLKGRQAGGLHRGHTWVFRAESHDTMMAWYEDIQMLTEKSPEEVSNFVRGHSRSISRSSQRSLSSDGMVDDEDDEPFSAAATVSQQPKQRDASPRRPEPGGRFPSDLQINAQRGLEVAHSPSSLSSEFNEGRDDGAVAAAAALPDTRAGDSAADEPGRGLAHQGAAQRPVDGAFYGAAFPGGDPGVGSQPGAGEADDGFAYGSTTRTPLEESPSHAAVLAQEARGDGVNPYTGEPMQRRGPPGNRDAGAGQDPYVVGVLGTREPASQRPTNPDQASWSADQASRSAGTWAPGDPPAAARDGSGAGGYMPPTSGYWQQATPPSAGSGHETYAVAGAGSGWDDPRRPGQPGQAQPQPSSAVRPDGVAARNDPMASIPHLHVPGEYPKSTPVT